MGKKQGAVCLGLAIVLGVSGLNPWGLGSAAVVGAVTEARPAQSPQSKRGGKPTVPTPPSRGSYVPPKGGGTRGCGLVEALVPAEKQAGEGLTVGGFSTQARPTFWFEVPSQKARLAKLEFVLQTPQGKDHYRTLLSLPDRAGLFRVDWPSRMGGLANGDRYRWFLNASFHCPTPGMSSASGVAGSGVTGSGVTTASSSSSSTILGKTALNGWVGRAEPSAALQQLLRSPSGLAPSTRPGQAGTVQAGAVQVGAVQVGSVQAEAVQAEFVRKVEAYQNEGFWFDALGLLGDRLQLAPGDAVARRGLATLLKTYALPEAKAMLPVVDCCSAIVAPLATTPSVTEPGEIRPQPLRDWEERPRQR